MFDLTPTPQQEAEIARIAAEQEALRALAEECESHRTPSVELVVRVSRGEYAIPRLGSLPDWLGAVMAAEQYARADPGIAWVIINSWQTDLLLAEAGDASPKLGTALVYEGFGRAPGDYRTTATRTDDGWSLSGLKDSVLHPGVADVSAAVARLSDTGELAVFRLDGTPAGYRVERDDASEGTLGLWAAHTGRVRLDGVRLGPEARVSTEGSPLEVHRAVGYSRLLLAAVALGCAQAALDYAVGWTTTREAFGKTISGFQGVAFVLADLSTAIQSARLLVWDAASSLAQAADVPSIEGAISRVVARATAVATDAGREGVNLLGVHGIVTDHPVERWYRAAAALSVVDFDPLAVALPVA